MSRSLQLDHVVKLALSNELADGISTNEATIIRRTLDVPITNIDVAFLTAGGTPMGFRHSDSTIV